MDVSGKEGKVEAMQQGRLRQKPWTSPTVPKWEEQSGLHDNILVQPTVQQAPEKAIVPMQI